MQLVGSGARAAPGTRRNRRRNGVIDAREPPRSGHMHLAAGLGRVKL